MTLTWLKIDRDELDLKAQQLDGLFWSSIVSQSGGLQKVLPSRADKLVGGDLFTALYHWNPEVREDAPDPAMASWISHALADPAFQELRAKTMGDKNLAAAGAVRLYRELMRKQTSDFKSMVELKNQIDSTEATIGHLPEAKPVLDSMKQAQQDYAKDFHDSQLLAGMKLEQNKYGQMDVQQTEVSKQIEQAADAVAQDIDNAQELADFDSSSAARGDSDSLNVLKLLLDEQLIERVGKTDKLRRIMKAAGRMKQVLETARANKPKPSPSPMSYKYGNELSNVVPVELAALGDKELEPLFDAKYANSGLLEYDRRFKPRLGRGPLIFCLDFSGSMSGEPEINACALFVAMGRIAMREHRKVMFMPFASRAAEPQDITSAKMLVEVLSKGYAIGSGTEFAPPLRNAQQVIADNPKYKRADIMFVTDGYSSVSPTFRDKFVASKKKLDHRVFGLAIGTRFEKQLQPLFDALVVIGRSGELGKLEWLNQLAPSIV